MVLLLLGRKGRRAIFWPMGSDSWWVWGYHLHDPPMTHLHLVHGGLEVTPEVRLRTSSCGGSTRPERMILSSVCGSSTSKSSLSVLRGTTLRCLSHYCEGQKLNIDSSLKVISTVSSKGPFIFLSYCFLSHLRKVLGPLPFLVDIPLWAFVFSAPKCYCITKESTCLSVPTMCSYAPGVCCPSHTRKPGVIWKPRT